MTQGDDVEDIFNGQVRTALTMAGHVGQVVARQREQQLRHAEQQDRRDAEESRARIDAERQAARADLAQVHRGEWWQRAGTGNIGAAWLTATTWAEHDTEAARAKEKMTHELYERYGVDVSDLSTAPPRIRDALREAEAAYGASGTERTTSREADRTAQWIEELAERVEREQREARQEAATAGSSVEQSEAEADASQLGQESTSLQVEAGVEYDSAERRAGEAHRMTGAGVDAEAVAARMHADTQHAQPARAAVDDKAGRGRRRRARMGRPVQTARRKQRGLSR